MHELQREKGLALKLERPLSSMSGLLSKETGPQTKTGARRRCSLKRGLPVGVGTVAGGEHRQDGHLENLGVWGHKSTCLW